MYFGYKHVETETSFLHKLTTFLKYQMPLSSLKTTPPLKRRRDVISMAVSNRDAGSNKGT